MMFGKLKDWRSDTIGVQTYSCQPSISRPFSSIGVVTQLGQTLLLLCGNRSPNETGVVMSGWRPFGNFGIYEVELRLLDCKP
jgi:hypothetical protein